VNAYLQLIMTMYHHQNHIYEYGKVCLRHVLLYYQTALFKMVKTHIEINSAASSGSHGKYMECVSFPWPALVAAHDHKRLTEHCIMVEVIVSRKTILIYRIQLHPSDRTIAFKLCRRQFLNKIIFAVAQ
jgi:hypothetical protein